MAKHASEECQSKAESSPESPNELELMKEIQRLRKELEESKKEALFLKKQRHSLQRKSIRGLSIHPKISQHLWCTLAASKVQDCTQCLLQLPEKPEVRL